MEEGRQNHGKVLWLLADACSMMLSPKSSNEPFKPIFVSEGKRSILPEDLGEDDIRFFSEIFGSIDEPWLKARISELLWLLKTPKDPRHALAVIESYRAIPLETETWVHGGDECWRRALILARMLRRGVDTHLDEMEKTIIGAFEGATRSDGFLGKWLADLLEDNGLGRDKGGHIAQKLETMAREFYREGDLHHAREYFSVATKWFGRNGDESKAAEMTALQAESWVKEAIARVSSDQPSYMVAASFYENAIQLYRMIPHKHRTAHRVDERLKELYGHLKLSGQKARDEMSEIRTPGIDISKLPFWPSAMLPLSGMILRRVVGRSWRKSSRRIGRCRSGDAIPKRSRRPKPVRKPGLQPTWWMCRARG